MTVAQALQAAVTLLIAGIATYIAYQQWRTNTQKLKLDLFDRRYRIFEEVGRLLGIVFPSGSVELSDIEAFSTRTVGAKFLFGAEIARYLLEISDYARDVEILNFQMRDPLGAERIKNIEEKRKAMEWLKAQFDGSAEKFKPYLDFTKL
jgi:hypothetical protein